MGLTRQMSSEEDLDETVELIVGIVEDELNWKVPYDEPTALNMEGVLRVRIEDAIRAHVDSVLEQQE